MKTILLFLFLLTTYGAVSENNLSRENFIGNCEDRAVDVYYALLDGGATWSEAAGAFHILYTDCCFNYPLDCDEMPIIG